MRKAYLLFSIILFSANSFSQDKIVGFYAFKFERYKILLVQESLIVADPRYHAKDCQSIGIDFGTATLKALSVDDKTKMGFEYTFDQTDSLLFLDNFLKALECRNIEEGLRERTSVLKKYSSLGYSIYSISNDKIYKPLLQFPLQEIKKYRKGVVASVKGPNGGLMNRIIKTHVIPY